MALSPRLSILSLLCLWALTFTAVFAVPYDFHTTDKPFKKWPIPSAYFSGNVDNAKAKATFIPRAVEVPVFEAAAVIAKRAPMPAATSTTSTSASATSSTSTSTATCSPFVTPNGDGYVPAWACNSVWEYNVNFGAAVFFSIVFGLLLLTHIYQGIKHRRGYCWVVAMGALWELISYVAKAAAAHNQQNVPLATISAVFYLLAPLWVNAFDYMVLARLVQFFSPVKHVFGVKPENLALIFVSLDILSFFVQAIGGITASNPDASPQTLLNGLHIYMGGIGLQQLFIIIFFGLALRFQWHMRQEEKAGNREILSHPLKSKWRWPLYALYLSLILITIRIIFHLVEYADGTGESGNPLPTHESYQYCLDALPISAAILVWNICHPSRYMKGPEAEMPRSHIISRFCCCCCPGQRRKRREAKNDGQSHAPPSYDPDVELTKPLTNQQHITTSYPGYASS